MRANAVFAQILRFLLSSTMFRKIDFWLGDSLGTVKRAYLSDFVAI
jgi:hypothetical protein